MQKFLVVALAAATAALSSNTAQAANLLVTVTETTKTGSHVVATWTQDQNPTPIDYVNDYYTTVPVFNATGLGGDTAVTWYSNTNGQLGGFTNFDEDFNVLAPASYAFLESSPTFVPGKYVGVDVKPDLSYIPTSYTIKVLPGPALKPRTLLGNSPNNADPAVPEPATWAMMIVGMGVIGLVARRGRKVNVAYAG